MTNNRTQESKFVRMQEQEFKSQYLLSDFALGTPLIKSKANSILKYSGLALKKSFAMQAELEVWKSFFLREQMCTIGLSHIDSISERILTLASDKVYSTSFEHRYPAPRRRVKNTLFCRLSINGTRFTVILETFKSLTSSFLAFNSNSSGSSLLSGFDHRIIVFIFLCIILVTYSTHRIIQ